MQGGTAKARRQIRPSLAALSAAATSFVPARPWNSKAPGTAFRARAPVATSRAS